MSNSNPIASHGPQQILSRELNLQVSATYVSLKSKGRTPGMEFVFDGKLRPGVPEFVATKAAPLKDKPVVVLVLTPWYDMIR